jgi:heterodisulfide reductase subunit C
MVKKVQRYPAAITSLIPCLSCRGCRSHAPFAELLRLSSRSIADEMREEHRRKMLRISTPKGATRT